MNTVSVVILSLLGAAIAIGGAGPRVAPTRETLRRYLADQIGYSDREWRDVLAGRAVAKNLETPEAVDVSIFGAVRVRGRARDLAEQIREIDTPRKNSGERTANLSYNDDFPYDPNRVWVFDQALVYYNAGYETWAYLRV